MFEDSVSLDATQLIPALARAGVTALKIEGRQPSRAYVAEVVRGFRGAVEAEAAGRPGRSGRWPVWPKDRPRQPAPMPKPGGDVMDLTIGPNQFFGPAETVRGFYAAMTASPATCVVLGELTVPSACPSEK